MSGISFVCTFHKIKMYLSKIKYKIIEILKNFHVQMNESKYI